MNLLRLAALIGMIEPATAVWSDFGCALTAVDNDRVRIAVARKLPAHIGAPRARVALLFNTDGTLLFSIRRVRNGIAQSR